MHSSRIIIDEDNPLSQSLLWKIQRQYFLKAGIDAWADDVVPMRTYEAGTSPDW